MLAKRLPQLLAAPWVLAAEALTSAPGVLGQKGAGQGVGHQHRPVLGAPSCTPCPAPRCPQLCSGAQGALCHHPWHRFQEMPSEKRCKETYPSLLPALLGLS